MADSDHDWEEIFQPGTQLRLHEGGKIANNVYEDPQTFEIIGVSDDVTDPDGQWPQALTLRATTHSDKKISKKKVDNDLIRQAIDRGDVTVI